MDESTLTACLEEIENHIDGVSRWSDFDAGYVYGIAHALLLGLRRDGEPAGPRDDAPR